MQISEVLSFFSEDRFVTELKSRKKESIMDELAETFVESGVVRQKSMLMEMIHRRESVGSTGIGRGIAIPHGRSTATSDIIVAFGKTKRNIDWSAIDGEPVHLVFMIVAPPTEEKSRYLPMLGRLVEFLNVDENRQKLLEVDSFESFKNVLTGE